MNANKIKGSILALSMGDAFGAVYEGGVLERSVWHVIGKKKDKLRFTDDTQMSIDIIESLIACGKVDQDDLARRFAESYSWSRGYGPGAAKILKKIGNGMPWQEASRYVFSDGSYGNGAAMRAAPIGLFYAEDTKDKISEAATRSAEITHAHKDGIAGAVLIALSTSMAYKDQESQNIIDDLLATDVSTVFKDKLQKVQDWLKNKEVTSLQIVRSELGNGIAASNSCVTAIYCALSHREKSFEDLLTYLRDLGGDVDTIGAMAGAIWGASNGFNPLPKQLIQSVEQHEYLGELAQRFALSIKDKA